MARSKKRRRSKKSTASPGASPPPPNQKRKKTTNNSNSNNNNNNNNNNNSNNGASRSSRGKGRSASAARRRRKKARDQAAADADADSAHFYRRNAPDDLYASGSGSGGSHAFPPETPFLPSSPLALAHGAHAGPFRPSHEYDVDAQPGDATAAARRAAKADLISRSSRPPSPVPPSPPAMSHAAMLALSAGFPRRSRGPLPPFLRLDRDALPPRPPLDPSSPPSSPPSASAAPPVWINTRGSNFPRSTSLSRIAEWTVQPLDDARAPPPARPSPFAVAENGSLFDALPAPAPPPPAPASPAPDARLRKLEARAAALSDKLAAEVDATIDLRTDNAVLTSRLADVTAERDALQAALDACKADLAAALASPSST